MKKALILLLLLLSLPFIAFADESDERIWYYTDAGDYNVQKVNLGIPIIYPLQYKAVWAAGTSVDNVNDPIKGGTYKSKVNVLGNVGVAYTDHQIKITVTADRSFVSQSDPTKYRDFCIAVKPKLRYGNTDYEYCWVDGPERTGSWKDPEAYVPTTKNGPVVLYTPQLKTHHEGAADTLFYAANAIGKRVESVSYTKDASHPNTASRFYCDMVLCMDQLTEEDEAHLATGSDYFATVNINAECTELGCSNPNHYLNYTIVLRAYYGDDSLSGRTVFMFVKPEAEATNINIADVIKTQNQLKSGFDFTSSADIVRVASQKIAEFELFTLPRATDFKTKLTVLVTASPSIAKKDTTSTELFYLKHVSEDIRIPFKVVIKSRNAESPNPNSVFDGSSPNYKLYLGEKDQKTALDRQGTKEYNSLSYTGDVYVVLKDEATGIIKESINGATVVYTDVTISEYLDEQTHTGLSGLYTSDIYYHIFLD